MAIEIRELLIRTFVGSQDNGTNAKDKRPSKKKEKERLMDILSDVSKMLQQSQER